MDEENARRGISRLIKFGILWRNSDECSQQSGNMLQHSITVIDEHNIPNPRYIFDEKWTITYLFNFA